MLRAALLLAAASLLFGWVSLTEIPALLDLDLLLLFFVLIVAVECARRSGLFARLVRVVLTHSRSSRGLAVAAILLTGATAALVTNDVALLLVVPFTLSFEAAACDFDAAPVVVLEIAAANLIGARLYLSGHRELVGRARAGRFWRLFSAFSFALLAATVVLSLLLLARGAGGQGLQSSP